jgi:hypothetical protein
MFVGEEIVGKNPLKRGVEKVGWDTPPNRLEWIGREMW